MFGDAEWIPDRSNEQAERFRDWRFDNINRNIVAIELGAGRAIPTARRAAESVGKTLIRINPRDYEGDMDTISIPLGSLEALTGINEALLGL